MGMAQHWDGTAIHEARMFSTWKVATAPRQRSTLPSIQNCGTAQWHCLYLLLLLYAMHIAQGCLNLKYIEFLIPHSVLMLPLVGMKCAVPCIMLQLLVTSCFMFMSWGPTKGQQTEFNRLCEKQGSERWVSNMQHYAYRPKSIKRDNHIMRGRTKGCSRNQ